MFAEFIDAAEASMFISIIDDTFMTLRFFVLLFDIWLIFHADISFHLLFIFRFIIDISPFMLMMMLTSLRHFVYSLCLRCYYFADDILFWCLMPMPYLRLLIHDYLPLFILLFFLMIFSDVAWCCWWLFWWFRWCRFFFSWFFYDWCWCYCCRWCIFRALDAIYFDFLWCWCFHIICYFSMPMIFRWWLFSFCLFFFDADADIFWLLFSIDVDVCAAVHFRFFIIFFLAFHILLMITPDRYFAFLMPLLFDIDTTFFFHYCLHYVAAWYYVYFRYASVGYASDMPILIWLFFAMSPDIFDMFFLRCFDMLSIALLFFFFFYFSSLLFYATMPFIFFFFMFFYAPFSIHYAERLFIYFSLLSFFIFHYICPRLLLSAVFIPILLSLLMPILPPLLMPYHIYYYFDYFRFDACLMPAISCLSFIYYFYYFIFDYFHCRHCCFRRWCRRYDATSMPDAFSAAHMMAPLCHDYADYFDHAAAFCWWYSLFVAPILMPFFFFFFIARRRFFRWCHYCRAITLICLLFSPSRHSADDFTLSFIFHFRLLHLVFLHTIILFFITSFRHCLTSLLFHCHIDFV